MPIFNSYDITALKVDVENFKVTNKLFATSANNAKKLLIKSNL